MPKKTINKATKTKQVELSKQRVRKLPRRARRKQARKAFSATSLPSSWSVFKLSLVHLNKHKKLFLGIVITYGVLNMLFVKGLSGNFQLASLRENLLENTGSEPTGFGAGVTLFGMLLGSGASASSDAAGAYQSVLVILTSLALIWTLRQTYASKVKIRLRDTFYKSTLPLVPLILVSFMIILQLIPAIITASLYASVQGGALATTGPEQLIWAAVLVAGLAWSLFYLSSSIFAGYIVTLPNSEPIASLRAARKLVRFRRLIIIRKILFLPVVLLLLMGLVTIPLIVLFAPAAETLFLLFSIISLAVIHSYYYTLYRALIETAK